MGCEYVCRCKKCMLQPNNGRCGKTVTGVSILTNMDQHTCGDLTKCGDFFCKQCFHNCRLNPASHQCKPPGDPGTLTPEHLDNIHRRVEARREGKRRKRREMAVLREIARQQTAGEYSASIALPKNITAAHAAGMLSQLADAAADAYMQHDLAHAQASGMPYPGISADGKRRRPVYEQIEDEGEEWFDDGVSIDVSPSGMAGPSGGPAGAAHLEVMAVSPVPAKEVQMYGDEPTQNPLLASGVVGPCDLELLVDAIQTPKEESSRMKQVADLLTESVAKVARLAKALGGHVPDGCCDEALGMLTNLQQLEKKLMDSLLMQSATAAASPQ